MVPGVPCVDRGNWDKTSLCVSIAETLFIWQESPALYLDVTYKDVDHFRKGSVHEL